MLCDCNCSWVSASNGEVPEGAIPGGHSEDGETLFIGRVPYPSGWLTIGKIQRSSGALFAPHYGTETPFRNYEVLIV